MTKVWIQLIIYSNSNFSDQQNERMERVKSEIVKKLVEYDILVMSINCLHNHFHFMVYLNEYHSINRITKILKSITLIKLREHEIVNEGFRWADDSLALSVSQAMVAKEHFSISCQDQLHLEKSFKEEIDMLLNEGTEKYQFLSESDILSDDSC